MNLEKHLLYIFESLYDAVLVVSKDTSVVYVNQAYTRQFGIPKIKIIGRKLRELEPEARIIQVIKSGHELINDYSYVHSLKKDVCANITPLLEGGKIIGAVAIMKDISEIIALQRQLQDYENYTKKLKKMLDKQPFSLLESKSQKMNFAVNLARKVAASEATVLLYGQTGVGKEIFAKAIHQASDRFGKPFIPINMASIPESLFESEVFGYEEGSFTGSRKGGKKGLFELSNRGTLFLDEIGEMPLSLQSKILRVIQERSYQKIGGVEWHPIDVRIICATNRNLLEQVKLGKFREDLYYRLSVVPIYIPPLHERKEDIPYLVNNILIEHNSRYGKYIVLSNEVYDIFEQYSWPGNVRELYNVLEQMIAVCSNVNATIDDVPEYLKTNCSESSFLLSYNQDCHDSKVHGLLAKTERDVIKDAVNNSKNRTEAIKKLGISRKSFYSKLKKYGLL